MAPLPATSTLESGAKGSPNPQRHPQAAPWVLSSPLTLSQPLGPEPACEMGHTVQI